MLVKPDGVARGLSGEIIRRIEAKGYRISALRMRMADPELLAEHYAEHVGKPFYQPLVEFMLSGPVVATRRRRTSGDRGLPAARGRYRSDVGRAGHDPR